MSSNVAAAAHHHDEDLQSLLEQVNWDFVETTGRAPIHDIHPWPARFIPDIPRELIRLLHPGDDSPVLDPFCGSGTTLVEASLVGLPGIGVDVNPLAVLISRVKTTPTSDPVFALAKEIVSLAATSHGPVPAIPRLDHWFTAGVQFEVARLVAAIDAVPDASSRDALRIALSRILVRVSNQESETRYAAIDKTILPEDVPRLFLSSARDLEQAYTQTYGTLFSVHPRTRVLHADILALAPQAIGADISLVITSPPYPNAYEYWLYHKYRMYWLGMDPVAARQAEIGARPRYHGSNPEDESHFESQMRRVFLLLSQVMRPNGLACFVVGRSIIRGRYVDNALLLTRAASAARFAPRARVDRTIRRDRRSFNLSHASVEQEAVMVFRLEKAG